MTTVHVHYDTIGAACADWQQPFQLADNKGKAAHYCTQAERRSQWFGENVSAQECIDMALFKGYPKGQKTFEDFHATLSAKLPRALGIKRVKTRREMGDHLDYHAMLKGNHDKAWESSTRGLKRGSGILHLCVDIGGNAGTDATRLAWRGIAGITLAEIMRKAGYAVEIVACFAVNSPSYSNKLDTAIVSCTVKPKNAAPDLGQLAATVGFAGFFRTAGFAGIVRACDNVKAVASSGLGHYVQVSGVLPVDGRVNQLFVPEEVYGADKAREWITQAIELLQGDRA